MNGGAIYATGPLSASNDTFTSDSATTNGGAVNSSSTLTLSNDSFTSDTAASGGWCLCIGWFAKRFLMIHLLLTVQPMGVQFMQQEAH